MPPDVRSWFALSRMLDRYQRKLPLVLVNGLAEQPESWFASRVHLARYFDVKVPEILVYDGEALHRHIQAGGTVGVDYLTDRLEEYLDEYVQRPPYHLVASSLGCQVVVSYAVRRPERVARLVLIGASGFHGDENLPVMDGVRRSDYRALIGSVFHNGHFVTDDLVEAFRRKFEDRRWRLGVLRTLRGTIGHSVAELLPRLESPTLAIWGADDRILSDVTGSVQAAARIPRVLQVMIPRCGHAPQIEKAGLVNPLISRFLRGKLRSIHPALDARRFLARDSSPHGDRAWLPAVAGSSVIRSS
ncbi:MAG: ornithine lipid biosynthesis O-acyltransferase OlsI [Isosphaeraceae bacterium]